MQIDGRRRFYEFGFDDSGLWTPKQLPQLAVWVEGGAGVTGTTSVTGWKDQSNNGYLFTAAGGSNPALVANAINGQPGIAFSNTTDFLSFNAAIALGTFTTFAVFKNSNLSNVSFVANGENGSVGWYFAIGDGEGATLAFNAAGVQFNSSGGVVAAQPCWGMGLCNGTSSTVAVNGGNSPGTGTMGATTAIATLALGINQVAGNTLTICEFIVCKTGLSTLYQQQVGNYFAGKYGLPA